jgi:hypothetical protein
MILYTILTSCIFKHYDNSIELGNGYYYIQDGNYSSIVKAVRKNYEGIGAEIVPPKVINYKFNESYIIAMSIDISNPKKVNYWLINKNDSIEIISLDSLTFFKENFRNETSLEFK